MQSYILLYIVQYMYMYAYIYRPTCNTGKWLKTVMLTLQSLCDPPRWKTMHLVTSAVFRLLWCYCKLPTLHCYLHESASRPSVVIVRVLSLHRKHRGHVQVLSTGCKFLALDQWPAVSKALCSTLQPPRLVHSLRTLKFLGLTKL